MHIFSTFSFETNWYMTLKLKQRHIMIVSTQLIYLEAIHVHLFNVHAIVIDILGIKSSLKTL